MLSWLITTDKQKSNESSSLSLTRSLMSAECEWVRKNQRSRSFPDSNRDVYTFFPPLLARLASERGEKKMVEADAGGGRGERQRLSFGGNNCGLEK